MFDAGARDFKEAPIVGTSQEVWLFKITFGVFRICDRSRRVEDKFFEDSMPLKWRHMHVGILWDQSWW